MNTTFIAGYKPYEHISLLREIAPDPLLPAVNSCAATNTVKRCKKAGQVAPILIFGELELLVLNTAR